MSGWHLGGVRIFVQKKSGSNKQIIAELQPLRAGSIYQVFGWEEEKKKISGIVVGDTDLSQLKSLTTSGVSFVLESSTTSGSVYVKSVEHDRIMCVDQTLRPDLECDAPVYNVDIELTYADS